MSKADKTKAVFCCVHGYVDLTPLAQRFTDTPEFQRLAFIKQLGPAAFVFSGADHTRKAHSIGVYHLARRLAMRLQARHGRAVVSDDDVEMVGLAGLLHDIGHACFSHLYDEAVQHYRMRDRWCNHEGRSVALVRSMVRRYDIPLPDAYVNLVCAMIHLEGAAPTWQADVISGVVDVDRMDYLCRDGVSTGVATPFRAHTAHRIIDLSCISEGRLAFHPKAKTAIEDMLRARTFLHERVYQHSVCIAVECMITDVLHLVEPTHGLLGACCNEERFLALHDGLIVSLHADERTPPAARSLLDRIWRRDFYQEAFRADSDDAPGVNALDALRRALVGVDAIVTARWIGCAQGGVRFSPPALALEGGKLFRVTVVARKRDDVEAARRIACNAMINDHPPTPPAHVGGNTSAATPNPLVIVYE